MLTSFAQQQSAKWPRANPRPQPEQSFTIRLPELNELVEDPAFLRIFELPIEDVHLEMLRSQVSLVRPLYILCSWSCGRRFLSRSPLEQAHGVVKTIPGPISSLPDDDDSLSSQKPAANVLEPLEDGFLEYMRDYERLVRL